MPMVSQEYQTLVLDDLAAYDGLVHPVKASLPERVLRRRLPLTMIHPNPIDEFCDPKIGPSYSVISRYEAEWRKALQHHQDPELESLYVEKLSSGEFRLLDGHHRWMAAHRLGFRSFKVRILNVTPVDEIVSAVARSERRLCVSFDLDEVLLTDGGSAAADGRMPMRTGCFKGKTLRKNAELLIEELHRAGCDVWVYTGSYIEEADLRRLLRAHRAEADGIVSGLKHPQSREKLRRAFSEKYELSLHIDTESIVCVDTRTKEYEVAEIAGDEIGWAARAIGAVKRLERLQGRAG